MPQSCQVIGIIEMEVDPRAPLGRDETLATVLRGLRRDCGLADPGLLVDNLVVESCETYGETESIAILHANLPQLKSDLEHELRRLIQRLLAVM
jgi:hypothetical protein